MSPTNWERVHKDGTCARQWAGCQNLLRLHPERARPEHRGRAPGPRPGPLPDPRVALPAPKRYGPVRAVARGAVGRPTSGRVTIGRLAPGEGDDAVSTEVRVRKPGSVSEPAFGHLRPPPTEPSMPITPDPATRHDALNHHPDPSGVSVRVTGHPSPPSAALTLARASSGVPAYVTAGQVSAMVACAPRHP